METSTVRDVLLAGVATATVILVVYWITRRRGLSRAALAPADSSL
jgi:hypothetical protein